MHADRRKWNAKHLAKGSPGVPAAMVRRFLHAAPAGRALDIAAGGGRHALFLAHQGYRVDALDISDAGLGAFAHLHPNIRAACVDLDEFRIPSRCYQLIVSIRFLSRPLIPYMIGGLAPGGLLIFETFVRPRRLTPEERRREAYLLRQNELLRLFAPLTILYYREACQARAGHPFASAALVAVNDSDLIQGSGSQAWPRGTGSSRGRSVNTPETGSR